MTIIVFLAGLVLGGNLGVVVMALMVAAKEDDNATN